MSFSAELIIARSENCLREKEALRIFVPAEESRLGDSARHFSAGRKCNSGRGPTFVGVATIQARDCQTNIGICVSIMTDRAQLEIFSTKEL